MSCRFDEHTPLDARVALVGLAGLLLIAAGRLLRRHD